MGENMSEKDIINISAKAQDKFNKKQENFNEKLNEGQEKLSETITYGKQRVDEELENKRDKCNYAIDKGHYIVDRAANDIFKCVDEFFINVKSAQQKLNSKISEHSRLATLGNSLIEDNEKYYLKVEVPGVTKKDVDIEADEHGISIIVDFPSFIDEVEAGDDAVLLFSESNEGKSIKNINFEEEIDINSITANFKNGAVFIVVPKVKASRQKIDIK